MDREPLARVAILSGTDDPFLRCGSASFIRGNRDCSMAAGVRRARRQRQGRGRRPAWPAALGAGGAASSRCSPRLLGLAALAWLIGLGLGWLIFRPRRKREGYL